MQMTASNPLMRLERVTKTFPNGLVALRGVDLDIARGEVHGLLGANGAGKSTLIKILSGAFPASSGNIVWRGSPVQWASPKAANDMGVATIHQHIPLVPTLSVLENVFLGETGHWRRDVSLRRRFLDLCERTGYWVDPESIVGSLSIGQRQMVAIFQALGTGAELIVMDEPTASLATEEREVVYRIVRHLSHAENKAILFVSHFLDEVVELTDCVTILRDGEVVMRAQTCDLDEARIAEAIVGRQIVALEHSPQKEHKGDASALLELRNVASQEKDEYSPLCLYHKLIRLRQQEPSLKVGAYKPVYSDTQLLAYIRQADGHPGFLIVLNLSHRPGYFTPSAIRFTGVIVVDTFPEQEQVSVKDSIDLFGDEALIVRLDEWQAVSTNPNPHELAAMP